MSLVFSYFFAEPIIPVRPEMPEIQFATTERPFLYISDSRRPGYPDHEDGELRRQDVRIGRSMS